MITIKAQGFIELSEGLKRLCVEYSNKSSASSIVRATLVEAAKTAMEPVFARVVATAPYDEKTNTSGIHLRDTTKLTARIPGDADKKSMYYTPGIIALGIVSVKKSAVSLAQEFGNARTPATAFLRSALKAKAQSVVNRFKASLSVLIPQHFEVLAARRTRNRK